MDYLPGSSVHGILYSRNTGVGCYVLLQLIFPIQVSNPGLLHYRQILYRVSHQGSPILTHYHRKSAGGGSMQLWMIRGRGAL